jgi:UDPglucose--hexose-1-phosphate uridylyltransferase
MELRKDPITRSWVITGDDPGEAASRAEAPCPFCSDAKAPLQVIAVTPNTPGAVWSARAVVHPKPLYHIEGEAGRRGDGIYDCMHSVGAHEVLIENPRHDRHLWNASDEEIAHFLRLAAERILDLKRDPRIKYISLFKDYGKNAGQEFIHPTSQITATMFVPRRVLYELRAGREYFVSKERCVFCDIIQQEERQAQRVIEARGDYLAVCPYAPRVPYEAWILPRFCAAPCNECALSPRISISCCTRRPAACIPRKILATGKRSTMTIIGTSKSFRSLAPALGPTPLRRCTIRRSVPRLR